MTAFQFFQSGDVRLAYLDFGGDGAPLVALPGHFGRATMFSPLAAALAPDWRVIALDQRGHGWSDSPGDYRRESYVGDVLALLDHLKLEPAVLLGHSLGGVNAYQAASRTPERVRALIIEDIGAAVQGDLTPMLAWPPRFPTLNDLRQHLLKQKIGWAYFMESAIEYPDGWGFRFDIPQMVESQRQLNGDWWADWLATTCPALLLHGQRSWAVTTEHIREMVRMRPHTTLVEFPRGSHTLHEEDFAGFSDAVRQFLSTL